MNIYAKTDLLYRKNVEFWPKRAAWVFLSTAILSFIFFGVIGLGFSFPMLTKKINYINGLKTVESDLRKKDASVTILSDQLDLAQSFLDNFESVMPNNFELESYLESAVSISGKYGFILTNLKTEPNTENSSAVTLNLEFAGDQDNLGTLVKGFEDLKRLTTIETLTIFNEPSALGTSLIRMGVTIYKAI